MPCSAKPSVVALRGVGAVTAVHRGVDPLQDELLAKSLVPGAVEADLAQGRTFLALRRLASLTGAYPDDLELQARRAAIYRQIGNTVQTGR